MLLRQTPQRAVIWVWFQDFIGKNSTLEAVKETRSLSIPMDAWRRHAALTALFTYLLIVFGGIVRITGSGMGCGDEWPLCNGQLFPPWDFATWIEWGHRLAAAFIAVLIGILSLWAFLRRRNPTWRGRFRLVVWVVILLVIQIFLGAVTVWLELPPTAVVLHLGTAMVLLAVLLLGSMGVADGSPFVHHLTPAMRMAWGLAALGGITMLLGGLVANLGAAPACQGFPLCNGSLFPGGHWRIHLHWIHRLSGYLLTLGVLALPWRGRGRVRSSAWVVVALVVAQLIVGAVMVLEILPQSWRIAHVALGTAVFATLVVHVYRRADTDIPTNSV